MKTAALLLSAICLSVEGFSPLHHHHARGASHITISQSSRLFAGGFGGGGASKKKAKDSKSDNKQIVKLKPKQQWDRYIDMKTETKIAVGIRMKEDDSEDWLRVGYVRSKDSAYTAIAVALQRALIAEVRTVHCSAVQQTMTWQTFWLSILLLVPHMNAFVANNDTSMRNDSTPYKFPPKRHWSGHTWMRKRTSGWPLTSQCWTKQPRLKELKRWLLSRGHRTLLLDFIASTTVESWSLARRLALIKAKVVLKHSLLPIHSWSSDLVIIIFQCDF